MLSQQATRLNATKLEIGALSGQVAGLLAQVEELQLDASAGQCATASSNLDHSRYPELHTNNPRVYDSYTNACQEFLSQCALAFKGLINGVLGDMLNCFVFVYLDDIQFSPSLQEHTGTSGRSSSAY